MGGSLIHSNSKPKPSEKTTINILFNEYEDIQNVLDEFYLTKKYNIVIISQLQKKIDNLRLKINDFILETEKIQNNIIKKTEFILQCFILQDKLKKEEKYLKQIISYYTLYNLYIPYTIQEYTQLQQQQQQIIK